MDDSTLFTGLFRSLALSAMIILAFAKVIKLTPGGHVTDIFVGILLAAAGFVSMSDPVTFYPGVFHDNRMPILAIAYSFSGVAGTIISTLVIGSYRLWIGGAGATSGLIGILIAAAAGILIGRLPKRLFKDRLSKPLALGCVASLSMISIFMLPTAILATIDPRIVAIILMVNIISVIILYDFLSNEKKSLRIFRTLEHDAAVDPLTHLANRRAFDVKVAHALAPAHNPSGSYSVIMIDIDHFKTVNDTYGHDAGDTVLAEVADIIINCVRKTDIVARFGGEEIAVLLPGTDRKQTTDIAEKIRTRIEQNAFVAANNDIRVTVSVGAAEANTKTAGVEATIKAADVALYSAKRAGRNRVETALAA